MKKYLQFIKESDSSKFLINLPDSELEERLGYLRLEMKDITDEISSINRILKDRKENIEENYAKDFPESIFDFNKEQLDWIFEHHNGITSKHYEISHKYLSQLVGFLDSGFNQNTNQFYFLVITAEFFNIAEDGYEKNELAERSFKFLGDNLKREDGYVKFGISNRYRSLYFSDFIKYINDNEVIYCSCNRNIKKGNISEMLEYLVERDLSSKDDDEDRGGWG